MTQQTKQPATSRIPAFKTREEEAAFWDTTILPTMKTSFIP